MFLSTCMHTFSSAYSRIVVNKDRVKYNHHACTVYCKLQDIVEYLCPVVLIVTTRNCISACMHCTVYTYIYASFLFQRVMPNNPNPSKKLFISNGDTEVSACFLSLLACYLFLSLYFFIFYRCACACTKYYKTERRKP